MMMKQLIQKAKSKFFEPDEVISPAIRRIDSPHEVAILNRPVTLQRPSAEQQRIELIENQIQQLRADVARWKNLSLRFAYDMRDLLTE